MSLVAISTAPDTGRGERWPDFDHREIVAATLIQGPRYVDVADERWDTNAQFIANARQDILRLIAEIKWLRQQLTLNRYQDPEAIPAHGPPLAGIFRKFHPSYRGRFR